MTHQAWIMRGWNEAGVTRVLVARERGVGVTELGGFLVDLWCLGVKDALATEIPSVELDDVVTRYFRSDEFETMEPARARALVEGAVDYAQGLGFSPHRDFRKARKVLNGIPRATRPDDFVYGKDGKPMYVAGPYDDEARVRRVLAILEARCGKDGFHYLIRVDEDAASVIAKEREKPAAEEAPSEADRMRESILDSIEAFYDFLESPECPEMAMTPIEVQGFFSGLKMLPVDVPFPEWSAVVFAPREAGSTSEESLSTEVLIGAMGAFTQVKISMERGEFEPALPPPDEDTHFAAARLHCTGVIQALEMRPDERARIAAQPGATAALLTLQRLAVCDFTNDAELQAWWVARMNVAIEIGRAASVLHGAAKALRSESGKGEPGGERSSEPVPVP